MTQEQILAAISRWQKELLRWRGDLQMTLKVASIIIALQERVA
jgi:hypothetical protein